MIKNGQRKQVKQNMLPGYVLVRMELTDESWSAVRNTPGVTGFVGHTHRPSPLTIDEVDAVPRARGGEAARRSSRPRPSTSRSASRSPSSTGRSRRCRPRSTRSTPTPRSSRCWCRSSAGRPRSSCPSARSRRSDARTRLPRRIRHRKERSMPPKKKLAALIKLQIQAGAATPAPPVGPALGQHGVNIMEFCKAYNAATESQRGHVVPVEISVYEDRSLHLHHQDAAGRQADPQGRRHREGLRRAAQDQGRHAHPRARSARSPSRRCPTSTPTTSTPPRRSSPAPPARWASPSKSTTASRRTTAQHAVGGPRWPVDHDSTRAPARDHRRSST